ncbi:hypothetical protein BJ322DRAFT_1108451 [Thelephora terrestris]|uniref:Uncharacterized protein n=1 Tax=Thelephora terrestris TaxID=56493 RepID=A0A9P6L623_9AGAM|nr:hypothetical protein BJ322DRAFT_1108451 [Thelephora terrestris]
MAQPVYDQHPLQTYFTESERDIEVMPGGNYDDVDGLRSGRLLFASAVSWVLHALDLRPKSHSKAFAERFKYNVISSPLLSASLQSTQRPTFHSQFPGRLSLTSETSSVYPTDPPHPSTHPDSFADSHWPLTLTCMTVVALIADNLILAALITSLTILLFHLSKSEKNVRPQTMSLSLDTLGELVRACDAWHSAVHDAVTIVEGEEKSSFYGPTSASSPSTSLRTALQSSLHTTQVQFDNIRQLFSALTSPADLAPLSEMYAPCSPIKSNFDSSSNVTDPSTLRKRSQSNMSRTRPHSLSVSDVPSETHKRATWGGSHSNLARSNTSPSRMFRRTLHGKHRSSDVSTPLKTQTPSFSAPVTPFLDGVKEEAAEDLETLTQEIEIPHDYTMALGVDQKVGSFPVTAIDGEQFGRAALNMRRKHMSGGLEAFRRIGYESVDSSGPPLGHRTSSLSPSSRFTLLHTSRHPLSISALNLALQGALSAKRYTCSHLLALRFEEEEEYWEDVRSVMTLLATSLADATMRLMEALDEAEKNRIKDETPSLPSLSREASASPSNPPTSPPQRIIPLQSRSCSPSVTQQPHSRSHSQTQFFPQPLYLTQHLTSIPRHLRSNSASSTSSSLHSNANDPECPTKPKAKQSLRGIEQTRSYAPTPSHLVRFASHVDALTCALNEARDNLEQCLTALRDTTGKNRDSKDASLDDPFADPQPKGSTPTTKNARVTVEAYERVRKELGLAFRECERGRDHLLHHIHQLTTPPAPDAEDLLSGSDMEELPPLGHDNGTDESIEERGSTTVEALPKTSTLVAHTSLGFEECDDTLSMHLESQLEDAHPNFVGAEEVFEADTEGLGGFTRERSKLTREERIALAKARRERKELGISPANDDWENDRSEAQDQKPNGGIGPGKEVVQELKDVIWRVGERRRKLAAQQLSVSGFSSSSEHSSASGSLPSPVALSSPVTSSLTLQDIVAQRRITPFTMIDSS